MNIDDLTERIKLPPNRRLDAKRLMGYSKQNLAAYIAATAAFGINWKAIANTEMFMVGMDFKAAQKKDALLSKRLTPGRKLRMDQSRLTPNDLKALKPLADNRTKLLRLARILNG